MEAGYCFDNKKDYKDMMKLLTEKGKSFESRIIKRFNGLFYIYLFILLRLGSKP